MRHGSSPRTWGCFHESEGERRELGVFPTHVGVFPMIRSGFPPEVCLPHARGGVSYELLSDGTLTVSSPRTWGCFRQAKKSNRCCFVFPTHVGVFLVVAKRHGVGGGLPHARGGAPSRGCPPKAPSSRLGLFTSTLDIDSFIWREWQKGRRTCLNIF